MAGGGPGTSLEGPTEAGVRGFLPRKIFEKQDARRCVLMHFGIVKVQLKFSRINAFIVEVLVIFVNFSLLMWPCMIFL